MFTFDVVQEEPLVVFIQLSDGTNPARWEGVENFAEAFKKLKENYPDRHLQLIPHIYENTGVRTCLKTMLAVDI